MAAVGRFLIYCALLSPRFYFSIPLIEQPILQVPGLLTSISSSLTRN